MNLLIVDDHEANRKLLRLQLVPAGHAVLEAANGVEALQVLERERVDAVISDILMPEMDGFRLCIEVRKSEKLRTLPFILYTSTYDSPSERTLAQTVGADCYVTKPAPLPAILEALHDAMKRTGRSAPRQHDETLVLRQYNESLVHKMEDKNIELQVTLGKLQAANEEVLTLNRDLESHVQQRTADLQSANRELESFSYSVSHDLRAPLRAIGGFADMLRRDHAASLAPDAVKLLERVEENVKRMGTLIDDLLEYSRVGRQEITRQHVNLDHLVRECLRELTHEHDGRRVDIVVGELPKCYGNSILLKQALLNLLANAFKYTRKKADARIEIGAETRGGEHIVHVRDNGVGFDMEYAGKLFEVFQRLHSSEFEGAGIGLAIVRRVIQRHGGRVWAEGKVDGGATFFFSLPDLAAARYKSSETSSVNTMSRP